MAMTASPTAPGGDRFAGAVAVVTGGASGIGKAVCERLAAEGAEVWVADLDARAADRVAATLPKASAAGVDVADPEAVDAMVGEIVRSSGRIDVLVNNAGVVLDASVWETSPADWARVLAVNLSGAFYGCRAALPHMIAARRGAIVNTASDAGIVGWPRQAAYCASKGGVVQLTRAAALDAAPYGVRVNCVCPAFTDTPLVDAWVQAQADPDAARAAVAREQPLGRIGRPEEIAAAIAYLASDEAAFVTGAVLPVDGGVTAR
jgi:meso-butanediol dehydrogenase/(S,S)-butanediol dehydrogenase/diacetyl reductase